MRRAMLIEPERFVLEEVPVPQPQPNEVIVKVERSGICGSDVHIYHGVSPLKPPVVLGHEFSGTAHLLGKDVKGISIGDRVVVEPGVQCGKCTYCLSGHYNLCRAQYTIGGSPAHDGAYADYVHVPADRVIPMPDSMSFEMGAMVEPVACGMHALDVAIIGTGHKALVIGAGPIGLVVAQAARIAGADVVVVADIVPQRLNIAKQLGADAVVNPKETDLVEWVRETYGEDAISHVFDTAATPRTFEQAIAIVRRGGRIINVGVPTENVDWYPLPLLWEIELTGMNMYVRKNFDDAIRYMLSGQFQVEPLISAVYPLAQIDAAYEMVLHDPNRLKVLLAPQEG
jgi:L-iditol 2-dehydrogenase